MRTRLDLLAVCALGLYRLWRLVARDAITHRWREAVYNRWPPTHERSLTMAKWEPKLQQLVFAVRPANARRPRVNPVAASIDCPWCAPTVAAAALTLVVDAAFGLTWPLAWWGALGTLVGLVGALDGRTGTRGARASAK